jgi:uncharacterized peroxidase-related enzyme
MSRISPIDPARAEGKAKILLDKVQARFGKVPNMMRIMATSPAVLEGYLGLSGALPAGLLNPRLREEIALAISEANQCSYCVGAHIQHGKKAGLTEQTSHSARVGQVEDARHQLAVDFALEVLATRGQINRSSVGKMQTAGFGDGEIIEIVANVALSVFTNSINLVADTEMDWPAVARIPQAVF